MLPDPVCTIRGAKWLQKHRFDLSLQTQSDSNIDTLQRDDESDNSVCSVTMVAIAFKVTVKPCCIVDFWRFYDPFA